MELAYAGHGWELVSSRVDLLWLPRCSRRNLGPIRVARWAVSGVGILTSPGAGAAKLSTLGEKGA